MVPVFKRPWPGGKCGQDVPLKYGNKKFQLLFYLYHFSFVFSDGVLKVVQGLDSTGLGRRCPKSKLKMGLSSRAFHLKLLNYPGYTSKPASSFGCLPRVVQCG